MKAYIPTYTKDGKAVVSVEAEDLRVYTGGDNLVGVWEDGYGFVGYLYHGDIIFKTAEAAWKYHNNEFIKFNERIIVDKMPTM